MRKLLIALSTLALSQTSGAQISESITDSNNLNKPKMQVVFALDATGSMSGLINAAKDKIWSIVNSLTQAQTTPDIQIGLIFYRDRGDAFITKRIQLTDSIDMVYGQLMKIKAQGGGDGPESVNQGLNEAIELFNWDKDTSTYKAIFLVGDYEPHMDYKDDVPYYVSCQVAKRKDIVLNTILMGTNRVAEKIWKEIATCNDGSYVNVNMNVNDIAIATPYDSLIASINDQIDEMRYFYGNAETKNYGYSYKKVTAAGLEKTTAGVKAQRAEYKSYYSQKVKAKKQNEFLHDVSAGYVNVDSLKTTELPDEFKNLSKDSLKIVIRQKTILRDSLQKALTVQVANRNKYIEDELAKRNSTEVEGSFNNIIFSNVRKQTEKKKIYLKGKAKY